MKENHLNVGQFVAFTWMMEESRRVGREGADTLEGSVIGDESGKVFHAIAEAVNGHANSVRAQLEEMLFESTTPNNAGRLDFKSEIRLDEVVKEAVSPFNPNL